MRRYKLLKFLYNELVNEIDYHPSLISNELNTKILSDKFLYNEKNSRLFLHKKVDDYYILINFSYLLPRKDKKLLDTLYNDEMINYRNNIQKKSMFLKAIGAEDNPELKEASNKFIFKNILEDEDEIIHIEDEYPDLREINFHINIINKKSEVMQYKCYFLNYQVNKKMIIYS